MEFLTCKKAIESGWKFGEGAWSRGYVSRKTDRDQVYVCAAGGYRTGCFYVDFPSWESTNYHRRVYMIPPAGFPVDDYKKSCGMAVRI